MEVLSLECTKLSAVLSFSVLKKNAFLCTKIRFILPLQCTKLESYCLYSVLQ